MNEMPDTVPEEIYNLESEQAVLGAILCDNRLMWRVDNLLPEDFYEPVHNRIFAALRDFIGRNVEASPITLKSRFENDAALVTLGNTRYLASLTNLGGSVLDIRAHAFVVAEGARRRGLIRLAEELRQDAINPHKSVADTMGAASVGLMELSGTASKRTRTAKAILAEIVDDMGKDAPCFSTGLPLLDSAMVGGLYQGRSYVFAGPPNCGKTLFATTIANNIATIGTPVLFIAAEMGCKEIMHRVIGANIQRGSKAFLKKDQALISQVLKLQREYNPPLHMCDEPDIAFDRLKMEVIKAVRRHGIKGFMLDGFWLVSGKEKQQTEAQHLQNVAQWIAAICKKENIFALYTHQLNRDGNLLGSDGPLRAADQVYHIQRPSETENGLWLSMSKSRYTERGNIGSENLCLMEIHKHGPSIRQRDEVRQEVML